MPQLIDLSRLERQIEKACDTVQIIAKEDKGETFYLIRLKSKKPETDGLVFTNENEAEAVKVALHMLGIPFELQPESLYSKW